MSLKTIHDADGEKLECVEYNGGMYPVGHFTDLRLTLPKLPDFQGRDDDIVILTYPKSGTHWIWEICNLLVNRTADISPSETFTMLEFNEASVLVGLRPPRLLNTHIKPSLYPRDLIRRKCKIINLVRNPKDVAVSKYHSIRKVSGYKGTFQAYLPIFLSSDDTFGPWFDYMKKWNAFFQEHKEIPQLHLYFEDMKLDLKSCVEKLDGFLGTKVEEVVKQRITSNCLFDSMKNLKLDQHKILRKGIIGDWKTHFTVAQNELFNRRYEEEMADYTFPFPQYM